MNFEQKTLNSFASIRDDVDKFRDSMNDWIIFLDSELKQTRKEVLQLKQKIDELEMNRHRFP